MHPSSIRSYHEKALLPWSCTTFTEKQTTSQSSFIQAVPGLIPKGWYEGKDTTLKFKSGRHFKLQNLNWQEYKKLHFILDFSKSGTFYTRIIFLNMEIYYSWSRVLHFTSYKSRYLDLPILSNPEHVLAVFSLASFVRVTLTRPS